MHSPKQKLGSSIHASGNCVIVLKGGVGMQDRLLHERQQIANEASTVEKTLKGNDEWKHVQHRSTLSIKGAMIDDCIETTSRDRRKVISHDCCESPSTSTDWIPLGVPLPKPPVLPNLSQATVHDSGASHVDELTTDDESTADHKTTMCDSKVYELCDHHKSRQCLSTRRTRYISMNQDELNFVEAACALSRVGRDIGPVSDTKLGPARLPPMNRQWTDMMRTSPSRTDKVGTTISSIRTMVSDRTSTTGSKKRQPLGPPPYTLRKIRKSILP